MKELTVRVRKREDGAYEAVAEREDEHGSAEVAVCSHAHKTKRTAADCGEKMLEHLMAGRAERRTHG